jgi:hypothetical protein
MRITKLTLYIILLLQLCVVDNCYSEQYRYLGICINNTKYFNCYLNPFGRFGLITEEWKWEVGLYPNNELKNTYLTYIHESDDTVCLIIKNKTYQDTLAFYRSDSGGYHYLKKHNNSLLEYFSCNNRYSGMYYFNVSNTQIKVYYTSVKNSDYQSELIFTASAIQ